MARPFSGKYSSLKFGVLLLITVFAVLYYSVDRVIMPKVTRQNQIISVPELLGMSESAALATIDSIGLVHDSTTFRIGSDSLQGLIADQNPRPNASVRPGRRIYLTVYRGSEPDILIPDVTNESLRNAKRILTAAGLIVRQEIPDEIPNPHSGMVTRTSPKAGISVPRGDSITVWYGRGRNLNRLVEVPNVVGQRYSDAEVLLQGLFFWPTLLDEQTGHANPLILRQSPKPGEFLPEGSTIRLFADGDSSEQD